MSDWDIAKMNIYNIYKTEWTSSNDFLSHSFTCVYSLYEKKYKPCPPEKQELQSIKFILCGWPLKRKSDSA